MTTIRPATLADAEYFATRLRPSDLTEVEAAHGPGKSRAAMEQSIAGSFDCRVALVGGDPVAVFGCAKHDELSAIPWLLGTPRVDRQRRFLTQYIPALVGEWREQFPLLFNFVHTNNKTSIRWLQWLGFTIADPIPFGVGQQLFHPFYSNRPCVPSLQ